MFLFKRISVAAIKNRGANYFMLLIFLGMLTGGCDKLLVEPEPSGSSEKNFEIFWTDIYNTYPYFEKDKVNWKDVYNINRPKITSSTTKAQLFHVLKGMLSLLSDGHKSLISSDIDSVYYTNHPNYYSNYDSTNVYKTYLKNKQQLAFAHKESDSTQTEAVSDYAIMDDSIIYYHTRTYLTRFSFESSFNLFSRKHPGAKALILDMRNNYGGNISTMLSFMGIFFDKPTDYIIIKSKTGPLENDFSAPENNTILPSQEIPIFSKPIVVLTDRSTASAGEHTVLAMKLRNNTTIVGDTTYGAFSFVLQRTLPNGMQFECVSTQITDINGNNYESRGVPPQIYTVLTRAAYINGRDDLMDKAIQILNK